MLWGEPGARGIRIMVAGLSLLLAACANRPVPHSPTAMLPGPLHVQGAHIVDASGARVRLLGVNWFGAESGEFVVGGLDRQPLSKIVGLIRAGGFNTARLPWSNELVERDPVVDPQFLTANPQLQGLHALEILDTVIKALGDAGIMVVLDNHRSRGDWCCDAAHGDGLWHTPAYPESSWLADWALMAKRYRDAPNVIAAELRNEIRKDPSLGLEPTWGDGNPQTDWRAAAARGAQAVLAGNPQLLIIVGGINYQTDLSNIGEAPLQLSQPGHLVYAAHDYAWDRSARELSDAATFDALSWRRWGYLTEPGKPYTAPVFISEFGGCVQTDGQGKSCSRDRLAFVGAFAHYLQRQPLDFAWWPLNGTQSAGYNRQRGAVESYGLLKPDWSGYANPDAVQLLTGVAPPR